jgi:hypothetical protein
MSREDPVELEVAIVSVRPSSVRIEIDGARHWLPRSVVEYDGELDHAQPGELVEITVPEWLAYEKGLI